MSDRYRAETRDLGEAMGNHRDLTAFLIGEFLPDARRMMAEGPATVFKIAGMVNGLHERIDEGVALSMENSTRFGKVGCKMGCAHCCYQPVSASTPELLLIAAGIPDYLQGDVLAECERVNAKMRGDWFNTSKRFASGIACPFLSPDKTCQIYPARPQACRTHFSMLRTACEASWRRRTQATRASVSPPKIPMPTEPKAIGFSMMLALDLAIHEAGLEVEMVELAAGMPIMLTRMGEWLDGARVFQEVRQKSACGHAYSQSLAAEVPGQMPFDALVP